MGSWVPAYKHTYLAKYLHATQHAWKKWPHRVLIDPFSGPGRVQVKGEQSTRDGGAVVAARQLKEDGAPFTLALVGDLAPDRAPACARRLEALGVQSRPFIGKAVDTVRQMVDSVPRGALALAYVDPYSLEYLDFEILKAVSSLPKVDLAVHFSTMDLARNVEFEFDPNGRARFDGTAPGWQKRVDLKKMTKAEARLEFFNYWLELVQGLGFTCSKTMPLVPNDTGHSIYRLVFFARHDLPLRVWGDVAKGPQRGFDF